MIGINWKRVVRAAFVGMMLTTVSAFVITDTAQAQYGSTKKDKKKKKASSSTKTLSPKIFKIIEDVQVLFEAEQIDQAKVMLDAIRNKNQLGPYDQTVIYQYYGQIYAEKEQYIKSADALEVVIRLGSEFLPEEQLNSLVFNIGQLYIASDQYTKGMKYLSEWFRNNPDPSATSLAFMASAYLAIEPADYSEALKWMLRAIDKSKAMGEEPRENWYSTLVALYIETKQMGKSLPVLELLVEKYPKRVYWMQLSYVYGELNREADQFSTLQSAYHQGLLVKSSELIYLAQLYMANQIPDRAGDIMEEGIKSGRVERKPENLRFLADALYTAKELDRAITWYEEAGKVSDNAETYFMLGQIYMQQEEWKKAIRAFENTLSRDRQVRARKDRYGQPQKGLQSIGTAHYNLGIALYSDGKTSAAKKSFNNAKSYKDMRPGANQWLKRIANES